MLERTGLRDEIGPTTFRFVRSAISPCASASGFPTCSVSARPPRRPFLPERATRGGDMRAKKLLRFARRWRSVDRTEATSRSFARHTSNHRRRAARHRGHAHFSHAVLVRRSVFDLYSFAARCAAHAGGGGGCGADGGGSLCLGLWGRPSRVGCRLAARLAPCGCVSHGLFPRCGFCWGPS